MCSVDPTRNNTLTGPLRFDFNDGAKLVGRERVRPEYFADSVVADHWVKGPHHFWMEVSTGLMLREWQPFNGLQVGTFMRALLCPCGRSALWMPCRRPISTGT